MELIDGNLQRVPFTRQCIEHFLFRPDLSSHVTSQANPGAPHNGRPSKNSHGENIFQLVFQNEIFVREVSHVDLRWMRSFCLEAFKCFDDNKCVREVNIDCD